MKVLRQKVLQQVVHADLCKKTFAESLILSLKSIFDSTILKFHIKKFCGHAKSTKTTKLFCCMDFDIMIIFIKTSRFLIVSDYKHTTVQTQLEQVYYSLLHFTHPLTYYTLACDSLDIVFGTKSTCII